MMRFEQVLLAVGQLNYTWTNTESLLIHLMAGLAKVDKETAIVIFLTLNTTRARVDMVERLAKMSRTPVECRDAVLEVTGRLTKQSKLRNKYSHCIYSFDKTGAHASTQLMSIVDGKKDIRYGKIEQLDQAELDRIGKAIAAIQAINTSVWKIVEEHGFPR